MDWSKIQYLIDKYYDGKTTLEEEKELKSALNRVDCPPELQAEREMMSFFLGEREIEMEKPINEQVLSVDKPQKPIVQLVVKYATVAAVILIAGFFFINQFNKECDNQQALVVINDQKICDEQIAKQEAEKALLLVAQRLNKGTSKLEHIKMINKPNEILTK